MADTKDITVTPTTGGGGGGGGGVPQISPWIIVGAIAAVALIGAILFATRH